MAAQDLLRNKVDETPTIYAYTLPDVPKYKGLLKVGYTSRPGTIRIQEQGHELYLDKEILLRRSSMRPDGTYFTDKGLGGVHYYLRKNRIPNPFGEWFRCEIRDVEKAIHAAMERRDSMTDRIFDFGMRPEQEWAVDKTSAYFNAFKNDPDNRGLIPHFLWNAKMRFGKTFTTYQLALRMGWTKVLVLTFKPAVKTAWEEDLLTHKDFEGWQFCQKQDDREFNYVNERKPFVCFASFQDVLGKNAVGGIKATNEWIQTVNWDCIVLDEYHYGAWGKNAKNFYDKRKEIQEKLIKFATRIPVFMYLTDFREYSLKDVIMQLEPELFRKVTGLTLDDFSLLVSLGVFNSELMNDAVYKFKRYEDSSLNYAGIDKHTSKVIGGWDTVMEITEEKDDEADNVISQSEEQVAPDVQEEPEVKPWESLDVGDKVMHKSLGEGIIVSLDDNYLFVRFKDRESKFLYPSAFENGYLSR